jgi:hypothetical protein
VINQNNPALTVVRFLYKFSLIIFLLAGHAVLGQGTAAHSEQSKIDSLHQLRTKLKNEIDFVDRMILYLKQHQPENDAKGIPKDQALLTNITTSVRLGQTPVPNKTDGILLPTSARITVHDYLPENRMYKISYQGQSGFVPERTVYENDTVTALKLASTYLHRLQISRLRQEQAKIEAEPGWIKVLQAPLRVLPGQNAGILRYLRRGQMVFLQSRQDEWFQIKVDNPDSRDVRFHNDADFQRSYEQGWLHVTEISREMLADESNHPQTFDLLRNYQNANRLSVGMSMDMVLANWGQPKQTYNVDQNQQWLFMFDFGFRIVYFEDGMVVGWTAGKQDPYRSDSPH